MSNKHDVNAYPEVYNYIVSYPEADYNPKPFMEALNKLTPLAELAMSQCYKTPITYLCIESSEKLDEHFKTLKLTIPDFEWTLDESVFELC